MDYHDLLSRLKEKFSLAATSTASLFYFLLLGISVIFLLLLIAIQFGWSTIAGMIFGVAAMGATLFCILLNTIMSRFGKGRAVFLGIIVLYLNLMSALAFSAPEFFSGLSLKKWMALSTIFFTATSGGSLALVSYERASRIVSIVIILLNSMVLLPDNAHSIKGLINAVSGYDLSTTTRTDSEATMAIATSHNHLDRKYAREIGNIRNGLDRTGNEEKTLSPEEELALRQRSEVTGKIDIGDRVRTAILGETVTKTVPLTSFQSMTVCGLRPRRRYKIIAEGDNLASVMDPATGQIDITNLNGFLIVGKDAGIGQEFWTDDEGHIELTFPTLEDKSLAAPTAIVLSFELARF